MNGTRANQKPSRQKVSDQELTEAYAELQSVDKVGERFGIQGSSAHRRLKKLDVVRPARVVDPNRGCSEGDCDNPVYGYDLCSKHYVRAKSKGMLPSYKPCTFDGCDKPHYGNGYCRGHNYQFKNREELKPLSATVTDEDRFWQKVRKGSPSECWEWTAYRNRKGYGRGKYKDQMWLAHRLSYTLMRGAIPDGVQLDHMCWNRGCVNPGHLRFATNAQNGQNRKGASRNSTTGVRGVSINRKYGNYQAKVYNGEDHINLGYYWTIAEAEAVVTAWRRENWPYSRMDQMGSQEKL